MVISATIGIASAALKSPTPKETKAANPIWIPSQVRPDALPTVRVKGEECTEGAFPVGVDQADAAKTDEEEGDCSVKSPSQSPITPVRKINPAATCTINAA